jgi:hypothetical protein
MFVRRSARLCAISRKIFKINFRKSQSLYTSLRSMHGSTYPEPDLRILIPWARRSFCAPRAFVFLFFHYYCDPCFLCPGQLPRSPTHRSGSAPIQPMRMQVCTNVKVFNVMKSANFGCCMWRGMNYAKDRF